jgi:hypothetical protein
MCYEGQTLDFKSVASAISPHRRSRRLILSTFLLPRQKQFTTREVLNRERRLELRFPNLLEDSWKEEAAKGRLPSKSSLPLNCFAYLRCSNASPTHGAASTELRRLCLYYVSRLLAKARTRRFVHRGTWSFKSRISDRANSNSLTRFASEVSNSSTRTPTFTRASNSFLSNGFTR